MRSIVGFMALLCVGCASQTPAEKPADPAVNAKPVAQIAQSDQTEVSAATTGSAASAEVRRAIAVPAGYRVVDRDGVKFYCSDAPQFGSRVKSKVSCMSQEQFERSQTEAQDKMRQTQGQMWHKD